MCGGSWRLPVSMRVVMLVVVRRVQGSRFVAEMGCLSEPL